MECCYFVECGFINIEVLVYLCDGGGLLLLLVGCQIVGCGCLGCFWQLDDVVLIFLLVQFLFVGFDLLGLLLVVGCIVVDVLDLVGGCIQFKWFNDFFLDSVKFGGIFIEIVFLLGECCGVVIGIGLNLQLLLFDVDCSVFVSGYVVLYMLDLVVMVVVMLDCFIFVLQVLFVDFVSLGFVFWQDVFVCCDLVVNWLVCVGDQMGLVCGVSVCGELMFEIVFGVVFCSGGEFSLCLDKEISL